MHSSVLRGSDFSITVDGTPISHESFFQSFNLADRLGIVTTHPLDGLGAATLIMSHVTAFYDRYRAAGDDFFAYPDFFSFQRQPPLARYGSFDIWPEEKSLHLPEDTWDELSTIASRAITILLVPNPSPLAIARPEESRNRAILESLRRSVHTCYAYAPEGVLNGGDTVVQCTNASIKSWGSSVVESVAEENEGYGPRWEDAFGAGTLTQTFKRITLDDALCCVGKR
jgi:hypothetical protein